MNTQKTRYRERTPWPSLAYVVLWGAIVLACYPVLAGWEGDVPAGLRLPMVAGLVGFGVVLTMLVGGLSVLVQETRLIVHLGRLPIVRTTIPFSEIESLRSVTYSPFREFGGWGVRGFGKKKAWTARGNRAVVLTLTGAREVYVGSDNPQRLQERIRTLSGDEMNRSD